MADTKDPIPQMTMDISKSLDIVTVASRAQSDKLRQVLERIDVIAKLNPEGVKNITDIVRAGVADGGCGIGCW